MEQIKRTLKVLTSVLTLDRQTWFDGKTNDTREPRVKFRSHCTEGHYKMADYINKVFSSKMNEKTLKDKADGGYLRPGNCPTMVTPTTNDEIRNTYIRQQNLKI